MKVITIESDTFEAMMERFEAFVRKVDAICSRSREKSLQSWLDNQEVCQLLNISKRTLQSYRDNGRLAFAKINHKMFYKPEDVQKMILLIAQQEAERKRKEKAG